MEDAREAFKALLRFKAGKAPATDEDYDRVIRDLESAFNDTQGKDDDETTD